MARCQENFAGVVVGASRVGCMSTPNKLRIAVAIFRTAEPTTADKSVATQLILNDRPAKRLSKRGRPGYSFARGALYHPFGQLPLVASRRSWCMIRPLQCTWRRGSWRGGAGAQPWPHPADRL